jgi:acetyl-CoA carboxylase carboxyltransferase component
MYMEELSLSLKLPNVKLVDGSSGGGSVTTIRTSGWSYMPMVRTFHTVTKAINQGIPNLGAIVGPAIGLGAARVTACHFSVMTGGGIGSLFNAGPNVIAGSYHDMTTFGSILINMAIGATFEENLTLDELGGPGVHCTNGTIDNLARTEKV